MSSHFRDWSFKDRGWNPRHFFITGTKSYDGFNSFQKWGSKISSVFHGTQIGVLFFPEKLITLHRKV